MILIQTYLFSLYKNQEEYTKSEVEAHMVAQKIISMKKLKDYKYHDFAVLMRSTTEFITYKKVLNVIIFLQILLYQVVCLSLMKPLV